MTAYREGQVDGWIETFATAAVQARSLAGSYLPEVARLTERWRAMLRAACNPRADAAAWAIIEVLPVHPAITPAIAGAVTGRAKATGLLELIADLESSATPR